jgi:hypothetical protein
VHSTPPDAPWDAIGDNFNGRPYVITYGGPLKMSPKAREVPRRGGWTLRAGKKKGKKVGRRKTVIVGITPFSFDGK